MISGRMFYKSLSDVDPAAGRKAPLLRQSPNIGNAYLTYDQSLFSGRIGWTYNGAMIDAYGDGTPTMLTGNPDMRVLETPLARIPRAAAA